MTPRVLRGLGLAAVWLVVALASGAAIFLGSSREVVAGQPRLGGPADPRRLGGRQHRAGAARRPDRLRLPGRRRRHPRQDHGGEPGGARRALRRHRQPARGLGRQGARAPSPTWRTTPPSAARSSGCSRWASGCCSARPAARAAGGSPQPPRASRRLAVVVAVVLLWEPWQPDEPSVQAEQTVGGPPDFLGDPVPLPAPVPASRCAPTSRRRRSAPAGGERCRRTRTARSSTTRRRTPRPRSPLREPAEDETVVRRWSPTATTTSAWTGSPARSATGRVPRRSSTPATTPRPARSGRRSASTRCTRRSRTYDRFAVAGNHDNGGFVADYLDDLGWTMLDGAVVDGPGGGPLIGVDDPRSSGLGNWRDETGLSFDEVADRLQRRDLRRRRSGWSTAAGPRRRPGADGRWSAAASTWSSAATSTSDRARPGRGANGQVGYSYTTARPAARRTPSPSAPSRAATRWSR